MSARGKEGRDGRVQFRQGIPVDLRDLSLDLNVELLMCGFIGHDHGLLFPVEIVSLCIQFSDLKADRWDHENSNPVLFMYDDNFGVYCKSTTPRAQHHAFGKVVVSKGSFKMWKLLIKNASPGLSVGICPLPRCTTKILGRFDNIVNRGYGFSVTDGYIYHFGKKEEFIQRTWETNDVIIIQLDMKKNEKYGTLKLYVNDRDYGYAFDRIYSRFEYKLAICMANQDDVFIQT